jgi:hypothetical protein
MRATRTALLSALAISAIAGLPITAHGQAGDDRTVEQFTCKDLMRESGQGRDTAIAFLHGFILGKSGQSAFNVENLTKQTDAFIEQCLDNPTAPALDTMMKVQSTN